MKDSLVVSKVNESWLHVDAQPHVIQQLSDYLTFDVPDLHHIKRVNPNLKHWDGKVRIFKKQSLPYGLCETVFKWCLSNKVDYEGITLTSTEPFNKEQYDELVKRAKLQERVEQTWSVEHAINKGHSIIVLPTGLGKSFVIYCVQQLLNKRTLVIVPTIQLVDQMAKDFYSYGYDGYIYKLYQSELKVEEFKDVIIEENEVCIGTWQTLCKFPKTFFNQFEVLFGDEVHEYTSKQVSGVIENCTNAKWKVGTTATLKNAKMHQLQLQGLFGPIYKPTTIREQIDKGNLSKLKIKIVVFEYSDEIKKKFWQERKELNGREAYEHELNFIHSNEKRNKSLVQLINSLENNCLLLFNRKEAHGIPLFDELKNNTTKQIFYIDGTVHRRDRESVREIFERENTCAAIASYGTFKRGVNIKNLHHLIYGSPIKDEVATLQSIGRTLRLSDYKAYATLWDMVDNLKYKGQINGAIEQYIQRLQSYILASFDYEIHTIMVT